MEDAILVIEQASSWFVAFRGQTEVFESRHEARKRAHSLGREHPGVSIVNGTPDQLPRSASPAQEVPELPPEQSRQIEPTEFPRGAFAGPPRLGRSVAIHSGETVPKEWLGLETIKVTMSTLQSAETLEAIRSAYLERTPVVYEVDSDLETIEDASFRDQVWKCEADFEFTAETAWELLWRNTIDLRSGTPVWPPAEQAVRLGSHFLASEEGDVILPDGRIAWCDGGPLSLNIAGGATGSVTIPLESLEQNLLVPIEARSCAAELAPDQLEAVGEPGMRARIIAPAGSGKTRVLVERARLLLQSGVPRQSLLLVAYNKRAQEEMANRTADLPGLRILTLNALGLAIVNGTRGLKATGAGLRPITESDVRGLIQEMVELPRIRNTDPTASWIEALTSVRLGLRDPKEVEASYNGDIDGFAAFFPRYRAELEARNLVDFDEMIYRAIELMMRDPELRAWNQRCTRVILADEFQDLNPAHVLLLRLLAEPGLGIFGVGDDDQTIYGYSGASPEWLVNFNHYVPGAKHHALSKNYRCPEAVVQAASNLLTRNAVRVTKSIEPGPENQKGSEKLRVLSGPSVTGQTLATVQSLLAAGTSAKQVVVLTRVNSLQQPVAVGLRALGIPVNSEVGARFLEGTGVKAALAWFSLATTDGPLRSADLEIAIQRPTRGFSPVVRGWVAEQRTVLDLTRLANRLTDQRASSKVESFANDLNGLRSLGSSANSKEIIDYIRTQVGLDTSVSALDRSREGKNKEGHLDDLRALVELAFLHPEAATFLRWLREAVSKPSDKSGVALSTIHKVKGLEWPHVIVHDASVGVIPHRLSEDLEEERRVFHVAITRAQETLTITSEVGAPSPFIAELERPGTPASRKTTVAPNQQTPLRKDTFRESPKSTLSESGPRQRDAFLPKIGDSFTKDGTNYVIAEITENGIKAELGKRSIEIAFGRLITVGGEVRRLASPDQSAFDPATGEAINAPRSDLSDVAFERLKAWRLGRSREDRVSAFVIASNRTLKEIAAHMPVDEDGLANVPGIGEKKLEMYGDEILAILDEVRE